MLGPSPQPSPPKVMLKLSPQGRGEGVRFETIAGMFEPKRILPLPALRVRLFCCMFAGRGLG